MIIIFKDYLHARAAKCVYILDENRQTPRKRSTILGTCMMYEREVIDDRKYLTDCESRRGHEYTPFRVVFVLVCILGNPEPFEWP